MLLNTYGPKATTVPTQDQILAALHAGDVKVTFIAGDGSEKEMICTLREDNIPEKHRSVSARVRLAEEEIQNRTGVPRDKNLFKVYAHCRSDWRAFRYERIISFQPL